MLKKLSVILIVIVMLFGFSGNCFADKVSDIKDQKNEAKKEQEDVKAEKSAVMKEVKELSDSIADNEDKLEEINNKIIKLNKEVKQLEKDLEKTEKEYNEQEDFLKEKLVVNYESGKTTYLDVLLNSKGILDFISKYYLVSEILQNDSDLLESIEEKKNKIENDKSSVEEKKKEARTQKAQQEKMNVLLTNQKTQKQRKYSNLSDEEKKLQKKIDEYDALIREEERKASQIAGGSTGNYVGGDKVWPAVGYYKISSGYGNRNTGIPGASTNHKGIDIACPTGTNIVSVLDGKVMFKGYNAYRGYYIMVDHGGGVVTLYQHCMANSYKVSVGDKVKAGQTIILSGSTGIGSGPHLHFEVLINGNNVRPDTWLKQS